jgi:hypothetical protein
MVVGALHCLEHFALVWSRKRGDFAGVGEWVGWGRLGSAAGAWDWSKLTKKNISHGMHTCTVLEAHLSLIISISTPEFFTIWPFFEKKITFRPLGEVNSTLDPGGRRHDSWRRGYTSRRRDSRRRASWSYLTWQMIWQTARRRRSRRRARRRDLRRRAWIHLITLLGASLASSV